MNWYFIIDPDGFIIKQVFSMQIEGLNANTPEGYTVKPKEDGVSSTTHKLNTTTNLFELLAVDINKLKVIKKAELNKAREIAEDGGCEIVVSSVTYRLDTDMKSRLRISGAVQMAMLAQASSSPFNINWTMEDNTVLSLNATGIINVGIAVGNSTAAAFNRCTALKQLVDEATTAEEINAITWNTEL